MNKKVSIRRITNFIAGRYYRIKQELLMLIISGNYSSMCKEWIDRVVNIFLKEVSIFFIRCHLICFISLSKSGTSS